MYSIYYYLLFIGVAGALWLGYKGLKFLAVRRFFKNLPQPPGHNFRSGHLPTFMEAVFAFPMGTHPQYYYTYLAQKYNLPGIFYIDLWPLAAPQIVVTDPDAAMQVLTANPLPKHSQIETFLRPFTGPGSIAASNGDRWKYNHRMVGSGFTASHVKHMVAMIVEQGSIFDERLRALAETGDKFDLETETSKVIFDVIGRLVFGFSLEAQRKGSPLLNDLRASISPATTLFSWWDVRGKANAWLQLRSIKNKVHKVITAEMDKRYEVLKSQDVTSAKKKAKCILDRIVLDHILANPNVPMGANFKRDAVTNLKALLLGGHGTTTSTYTFVIMFLSINPDVLSRVRAEHDELFGASIQATSDKIVAEPSLTNKLEYTNAVIKETLRFYPIGFTIRENLPGTSHINFDGRRWPTGHGAMIIPSTHTTHMDPSLWKDPHRFRPERFLGDEGAAQHRFAWRPFERGPRACIAQDLAMDELRIIMLLTVRWFDFELLVENRNEKPRADFTDLDTIIGDLAFQQVGMEAKPSKSMRFQVRQSDRDR